MRWFASFHWRAQGPTRFKPVSPHRTALDIAQPGSKPCYAREQAMLSAETSVLVGNLPRSCIAGQCDGLQASTGEHKARPDSSLYPHIARPLMSHSQGVSYVIGLRRAYKGTGPRKFTFSKLVYARVYMWLNVTECSQIDLCFKRKPDSDSQNIETPTSWKANCFT